MQVDLDDFDRKILTLLQEDSRMPYSEISRRVKLSETAVRYRVSKLFKNRTIDRLAAILNPRNVGYLVSAIIMVKVDHEQLKDAFNTMAAMYQTSHMVQTSGEYDVIAVVHTKDNSELNDLAAQIRGLKGVKEATILMTTGLYKLDFRFKL